MSATDPPNADVERQGDTVEVRVPDTYVGEERIDKYLTNFFPDASRTKIQRSIKQGQALVNGESIQKSYPVQPGDRIVCRLVRRPPIEAEPEDLPLDVVYEDDHLIVVNKQAGRVVHPAPGHPSGTLVNALLHHVEGETVGKDDGDLEDEDVGLSMANALPERPDRRVVRPGIVHRLDKGTSGLLVVAKTDEAHQKLARQFKERTTKRQYGAIVWGRPDPPSGTITGAIGRDPRNRKRMAVVSEQDGKSATTHYETVERLAHTAIVRFKLETGRTHQVRVHAKHIHHPLLGDPKYGGQAVRYGTQGRKRKKFFERLFDAMPRQALHAEQLGFTHPATGETVTFTSTWPDDMAHVRQRLRAVEGAAA